MRAKILNFHEHPVELFRGWWQYLTMMFSGKEIHGWFYDVTADTADDIKTGDFVKILGMTLLVNHSVTDSFKNRRTLYMVSVESPVRFLKKLQSCLPPDPGVVVVELLSRYGEEQ